jgi:hypothetical protein
MQDIEQLKQALLEGAVNVTFTKADGTTRHMLATLESSKLNVIPVGSTNTNKINNDPALIRVYDLEAEGWRSFRAERIQNWQKA